MRTVEVGPVASLADLEAVAHLAGAVRELRAEAERLAPRFERRTVWMVNSTERGGGVAEMLPPIVYILRELGVATEWLVLESDDPAFFRLTKRLHNMIHGEDAGRLHASDRRLFERVNRENAAALLERIQPGDILVVHDPQPLPLGRIVTEKVDVLAIWRSHIGLDARNACTRMAWRFLRPYFEGYRHAVFSAPEYIPDYLAGRSSIIYPGIDPLTPKNRDLGIPAVVGTLVNAGLAHLDTPVPTPAFEPGARVLRDGGFVPAAEQTDLRLIGRPIITQVSRWDRLKGWRPLMEGFVLLKQQLAEGDLERLDGERRRALELSRLVLAGPEPDSIADDPEGVEVLEAIIDLHRSLDPGIRDDIVLVALPMASVDENARIVNALQRASTIVVQNSLREGFGLTVTEAMWKRVPVLTNSRACGPRQQVRDRLDGRLIADPSSPAQIADALVEMLGDPDALDRWGRNAQRRVHEHFLIFSQLRAWARLLEGLLPA